MKITGVIIDDDDFARRDLGDLLRNSFSESIEVTGVFADPAEAVAFINETRPGLLFLDIQMPGMDGFELLHHIDTNTCEVIFCTSFNQYAIQAIKFSALDYLLKPVRKNELEEAIGRMNRRSEKTLSRLRLSNLHHNLNSGDEERFNLVIATKQGEHQFAAMDIIRCEADSNYTAIHLVNKRKFLASKTLGDIEEMLAPGRFLRIHKSHLVNAVHIASLTAQAEVLMSDNERLPISRRRLQEVKDLVRKMN